MAEPITITVRSVRIDQAALMAPSSPLYRGFAKAAGRTRDRAKVNLTRTGRIDTGRARNSIAYEIQVSGPIIRATVGSDVTYFKYLHDGTANNGQGFIYPRRATLLRFKPRGASGYVYAKKVRGIKGTPVIADAIAKLTEADFTV